MSIYVCAKLYSIGVPADFMQSRLGVTGDDDYGSDNDHKSGGAGMRFGKVYNLLYIRKRKCHFLYKSKAVACVSLRAFHCVCLIARVSLRAFHGACFMAG